MRQPALPPHHRRRGPAERMARPRAARSASIRAQGGGVGRRDRAGSRSWSGHSFRHRSGSGRARPAGPRNGPAPASSSAAAAARKAAEIGAGIAELRHPLDRHAGGEGRARNGLRHGGAAGPRRGGPARSRPPPAPAGQISIGRMPQRAPAGQRPAAPRPPAPTTAPQRPAPVPAPPSQRQPRPAPARYCLATAPSRHGQDAASTSRLKPRLKAMKVPKSASFSSATAISAATRAARNNPPRGARPRPAPAAPGHGHAAVPAGTYRTASAAPMAPPETGRATSTPPAQCHLGLDQRKIASCLGAISAI
jgi:hypothetical protein